MAIATPTIRPGEAAHFGKLAAEWWDPDGSSAMLHKLNPVRLGALRQAIDAHWSAAAQTTRPLAGKRALDVGCGAGLACEPLARLGAAVTGVDAATENIAAGREHAAAMGLHVSYFAGELADLPAGTFDLVTAFEVIEHVADKPAFVAELSARLAPGGLLVLSTPNRTAASRLLMVEGAERIGLIPRGTHHWDDFITPDELTALLASAGLTAGALQGIAWSPGRGLHLSADTGLNYIMSAHRS
ncbi:bifunctional 2-polyprenyl-6-hydroxyphenol methylase/3-demethylubiquinol 3-O-methyltransferase UbiG [Parablastomonas sp. CN1-191]|uniref:bifunctional 2-polyprenyl-6-hydroxyphenol methylase/3-demethylubiquinol 3-O-methyltransferase UbiG n=1 Tax=Parablastomonas sp. CN1-191 TaxID=3400908 RepID=UPI003BF830F4